MVECDQCKTRFNKKPFRCKRDSHHFCCKECLYKWKEENPMTDETKQKLHDAQKKYQIKNPQPSGVDSIRFTGKLVMCNYCGEKVLITNNEDNRHSIHFCNRKCYDNYRIERKYSEVECTYCGKSIIKRSLSVRHHLPYCSKDCMSKHFGEIYKGENAPGWKGGISFEIYPKEWNNKLKQLIRERDNYICQECGISDKERILHIHHIDYNKNNNELINLITLCNVCHAKTNWNRSKWQDYYEKFMRDIICL